jgi:hypothetical protein
MAFIFGIFAKYGTFSAIFKFEHNLYNLKVSDQLQTAQRHFII